MWGLELSLAEAVNIALTAAVTLGVAWWFNRDVLRGLRTLARGVEEAADRDRLYNYDEEGNPEGVVIRIGGTSAGTSEDSGELTERAVASDSVEAQVTRAEEGEEEEAGAEDTLQLGDEMEMRRDRPAEGGE